MDLPDYQFEDPCPPNLRQVTVTGVAGTGRWYRTDGTERLNK